MSGLAQGWWLANFGSWIRCRKRLRFQDMLNYKRRKFYYDWYGRTRAPSILPSMKTLVHVSLSCSKAHISEKICPKHNSLSTFILQTITRCCNTYTRQSSHIVTRLHWLLCGLILAASYQEECTAFSSQALPPWLCFWLECSPVPLRRRDGEEQKWENDLCLCRQSSCCWVIPPKKWEGRSHR